MIRLISPATSAKPETIVICEGLEGIVERKDTEQVHHRNNEDDKLCSVCGQRALVWLSSAEKHSQHSARCNIKG